VLLFDTVTIGAAFETKKPTNISQAGSGANFSIASSHFRTRLTPVAIVRVVSSSHVSSSFSPVRRTPDGLARAMARTRRSTMLPRD
jgi:hypothetical protein